MKFDTKRFFVNVQYEPGIKNWIIRNDKSNMVHNILKTRWGDWFLWKLVRDCMVYRIIFIVFFSDVNVLKFETANLKCGDQYI